MPNPRRSVHIWNGHRGARYTRRLKSGAETRLYMADRERDEIFALPAPTAAA